MFLRVVTVTIAPGKHDEYWAWAREILDLWDERGVRRAGGPYAYRSATGDDTAVWLTVHDSDAEVAEEFRTLYADGRGRELIQRRPPLVAETRTVLLNEWERDEGRDAPTFPWPDA